MNKLLGESIDDPQPTNARRPDPSIQLPLNLKMGAEPIEQGIKRYPGSRPQEQFSGMRLAKGGISLTFFPPAFDLARPALRAWLELI
jgi:hypothetical protein